MDPPLCQQKSFRFLFERMGQVSIRGSGLAVVWFGWILTVSAVYTLTQFNGLKFHSTIGLVWL